MLFRSQAGKVKVSTSINVSAEKTKAVGSGQGALVFDNALMMNAVSVKPVKTSYELLSEEDLEEQFKI